MSDHYRTLTVILDRDMRAEDVEPVASAIRLLDGVDNVVVGDSVLTGDDLQRALGATEAASLMIALGMALCVPTDKSRELVSRVKRELGVT